MRQNGLYEININSNDQYPDVVIIQMYSSLIKDETEYNKLAAELMAASGGWAMEYDGLYRRFRISKNEFSETTRDKILNIMGRLELMGQLQHKNMENFVYKTNEILELQCTAQLSF